MFKEENNMKFKKFMALGLVAAMTATLFAGCGSKGNDSADTTPVSYTHLQCLPPAKRENG